MTFTELNQEEIDQGWNIVEKRYQFLTDKGIDQYPSLEFLNWMYYSKVETGTFVGLRKGSRVVAVLGLTPNSVGEDWEHEQDTSFMWLSSFFTDPDYAGIGVELMNHTKEYCREKGYKSILLDCHCDAGVLDNYYGNHGFELIRKQRFVFGERSFTSALMEFVL